MQSHSRHYATRVHQALPKHSLIYEIYGLHVPLSFFSTSAEVLIRILKYSDTTNIYSQLVT